MKQENTANEQSRNEESVCVSILTVNYNTLDFIKLLISKVYEYADMPFELIVVDNGSTDGSLEYLRNENRVRLIEIGRNIGHGPALDYAMIHVKTRYVVVMDSDAHPISDKWLSSMIAPLNSETLASGIYHHRNYVHPACMAIETEVYFALKTTFRPNWPKDGDISKLGVSNWDAGEHISMRILKFGKKLHYFELSNKPDVAIVGSEYGGIVYHQFYGTRLLIEPDRQEFDGIKREDILSVQNCGPAKQQQLSCPESSSGTELSVVVTAYNRPDLLGRLLEGFANQTEDKNRFEVIVVDDGSEPSLENIVTGFGDKINTVYLRQENSGLSAARNAGIQAAKGSIVLFSDDDDIPSCDLVSEHLRSHRQNPDERIAVLGHLDWNCDLEITPLMHYITGPGGEYLGYAKMQDAKLYDVWKWWGGLISAKRSLLTSIDGPFDERLRFGYEDTELACRLRDKQVKVLYNAKAKSFIVRPIDFDEFCRRRYKQGKALYYVAQKHPGLIIPRYGLENAEDIYTKNAGLIEECIQKAVQVESMLRQDISGAERDKLIEKLFELYRVCFYGMWLKGYLDRKHDVESGRVRGDSAVNAEQVKRDCQADIEYNEPVTGGAGQGRKIVMISPFEPCYDRGSSNLRIYELLRIMEKRGDRVDFLYYREYLDGAKCRDKFGDNIRFERIEPSGRAFGEYFESNKNAGIDFVWITNLWSPEDMDFFSNVTLWLKQQHPQIKVIIDTMDLHYKKWIRKYELSEDSNDLKKAERFLQVEKRLYQIADKTIVVSESEKQGIVEHVGGRCNVSVIPNIHRMGTNLPPVSKRRNICFLGSLNINHNKDAVDWFVNEVFEKIVRRIPDAEFHILGFNNDGFKDEYEAYENVKMIGYVEDADRAVSQYRMFVCPMRYGAGMKGKIGTAAANETPVVTTSVGAEGFRFADAENGFIADSPQQFADKCVRMLEDETLADRLAKAAYKMVAELYSIATVSRIVAKVLSEDNGRGDTTEVAGPVERRKTMYEKADSNDERPKVTVITSCCNSEKFLHECVESIRSQSLSDFELILIDDGSKDETAEIITDYAKHDGRIKAFCFGDNKGPYVRRNFAIERSRADYIVIHDDDDIMAPDKLEKLYNAVSSEDRLGVVGSYYKSFYEEYKSSKLCGNTIVPLENEEILQAFYKWSHVMSMGASITRKSLYRKIGLYDTNRVAADRFWFAKLGLYAKYNSDVTAANIPEYLTYLRIHDSAQTQSESIFDPRGKRQRYKDYCKCKLDKIEERYMQDRSYDFNEELKRCCCGDFTEIFADDIERWENQPLDEAYIRHLMEMSVLMFNREQYIGAADVLNNLEKMCPEIGGRFVNFHFLKAMAFLSIEVRQKGIDQLRLELREHDNEAVRKFMADYFGGLIKGSVVDWCAENSERFDLEFIDTTKTESAENVCQTV